MTFKTKRTIAIAVKTALVGIIMSSAIEDSRRLGREGAFDELYSAADRRAKKSEVTEFYKGDKSLYAFTKNYADKKGLQMICCEEKD